MVKRYRSYFIVALILFLIGAWLGGAQASSLSAVLTPMMHGLKQEAVTLKHESVLATALALFYNNLRVSLIMMAGGLVLGILPFLVVIANGALVGYVLATLTAKIHISLWLAILTGILPHGIFEIPAYLLASAYGMRIGATEFRAIARAGKPGMWAYLRKDLWTIVLIVAVLLLVAAFIESSITPVLLRLVIGG